MKDTKENIWTKTKIGIGSAVKMKVGDMGENKREERGRRTREKVVEYVHTVVGKKILIFKFKYGKNKEIDSSLLSYLSSKEEVGQEAYDTISDPPQIVQGGLLTINDYRVCEVYGMFQKCIYLYLFYCLCFVEAK